MNTRTLLPLLASALFAAPVGAIPRVEGGNDYYRVVIVDRDQWDATVHRGLYTCFTGPGHPLTASAGRPAELLAVRRDCATCGGYSDLVGSILRSHSSATDYALGQARIDPMFTVPEPGFTCENLSAIATSYTEEAVFGGSVEGVRAVWDVVNGDDAFHVELLQRVQGEDWIGSSVEVTLSVRNAAATPLVLGMRHLWPPRLTGPISPSNPGGGTVGRFWVALRPPDPPTTPPTTVETEWVHPTFRSWVAIAPDFPPDLADLVYSVAAATAGPATLVPRPTPPDLVQVVAASLRAGEEAPFGGAADHCFDWHPPDPPRALINVRGQVAIVTYWGLDAADAFVLAPGETASVTQYLVAFKDYPLSARTDGPFEAPCEGSVTHVAVSGAAETLEPTVAAVHHRWTSADARVSFADATVATTDALVEGQGTFPVTLTVSVGAYEASADSSITILPPQGPQAPTSCADAAPPTSSASSAAVRLPRRVGPARERAGPRPRVPVLPPAGPRRP